MKTFLEGGNLDTNNLSTNYSNLVMAFDLGTLATATYVRRFKIPGPQVIIWTEWQIGRGDGGGTATVTATHTPSGGSAAAVVNGTFASDGNDETETHTSFSASSMASATEVIVSLVVSTNPVNECVLTLFGKALVRT